MPVVFDACVLAARSYFHRVGYVDRPTWHITIYDHNFWSGDDKVVIRLEPYQGETLVRIIVVPYGFNGNFGHRAYRLANRYLDVLADEMRLIEDQQKH